MRGGGGRFGRWVGWIPYGPPTQPEEYAGERVELICGRPSPKLHCACSVRKRARRPGLRRGGERSTASRYMVG